MTIKFTLVLLLLISSISKGLAQNKDNLPNIVLIFVDDMGYGDLGNYGHPTIYTPNLDKMAQEGMKFTQFTVAAPVCTPSRAALLTGRYAIRTGLVKGRAISREVLFETDTVGLPQEEVTIAEILKEKDYATMAIGKWHLGHLPEFLPTAQGFDAYYGIPYSNDMEYKVGKDGNPGYWNVPIMRNEEVIERPANQNTVTKRYTEEAIKFIKEKFEEPFFLYLAHTMPHIPLYTSEEFKNTSRRGLYGDVVEELDWSVGEILKTLREQGIDKETLVIFTSDNGPWLYQKLDGGSAGLLKGGKNTTWEGGFRVPMIARWPGTIPPNQVIITPASTLDLLPTFADLTNTELPAKKLDGKSILPLFERDKNWQRKNDFFAYYRTNQIYAARLGDWKVHFFTQTAYPDGPLEPHDPPLLYNIEVDPSEEYNKAEKYPKIIAEIKKKVDSLQQNVGEWK